MWQRLIEHFQPERYWARQTRDEKHGPAAYRQLQTGSLVVLDALTRLAPERTSTILDVGCNVGRHLNALWEMGYLNLSGVDVQTAAWDDMAVVFPSLSVTQHRGTFQEQLPRLPSRGYEVVLSYGATVELVPLSFDIARELARLTGRWLILAINEQASPYPRNWRQELMGHGLRLHEKRVPLHLGSQASLLIFERGHEC